MSVEIRLDEWQAEMERLWAAKPQDEGFTVAEWAERLGWGGHRAQAFIKAAVKSEKMVRGQRFVPQDWDGRARYYSVYRPAEGKV